MRSALAAVFTVLAGCATTAHSDAPAVLVQPDAQTRTELRDAVARALQTTDVTLADDALTKESVLLIERAPARDASGQRLSGRDFDQPERFRLIRTGDQCVLIHERTGQRYELRAARCAAPTP